MDASAAATVTGSPVTSTTAVTSPFTAGNLATTDEPAGVLRNLWVGSGDAAAPGALPNTAVAVVSNAILVKVANRFRTPTTGGVVRTCIWGGPSGIGQNRLRRRCPLFRVR